MEADAQPGDGGSAAALAADFKGLGSSSVGTSQTGGRSALEVARSLLGKFAFPAARWSDDVAKLSGGEQRRLQLLACLAARPNVLVLDEPTNDLDLETLGVLENFLADFPGVLVNTLQPRFETHWRTSPFGRFCEIAFIFYITL